MPKVIKGLYDDEVAMEFFKEINRIRDYSELHKICGEPVNHKYFRKGKTKLDKHNAYFTSKTWERIKKYILRYDLAVHVINACMGFGCGIELYTNEYVGMHIERRRVTTITMKDFKAVKDEYSINHVGHMQFDEAWEILHPLASTEKNAELLKKYGLGPLRDKGCYEY